MSQGKVSLPVPRPGPKLRGKAYPISAAVLVFLAFVSVSSAGYYYIEKDYTWLDAVYMTVITVSTVGLRELGTGLSIGGRLWTMFVIAGGLVTGAVLLSVVVAAVVEGRLRRVLGRRELKRRIAALSQHVIVCGYGRMGQMVAEGLRGAESKGIVAVDRDPERTSQADADGLLYVLGDAQEEATLEAAGVDRAGGLIAALPSDAGNVFVTLTARGLNRSLPIIARAEELATQDKLTKAGATRVICPHTIGASRIVDVLVRPAMVDFVEMAHKGVDLEMDELAVRPGSEMVGRTLRELALRSRAGATVVVVQRSDGTALYNPGPEVALSSGDSLVLIGKRGVAAAIRELGGLTDTASGPVTPPA